MKTAFIEASSTDPHSGSFANHGKFMVACWEDEEWERPSEVDRAYDNGSSILLHRTGWGRNSHFLVTDLQTGEGAIFSLGGYAKGDLEKHAVWVCPLFGTFLDWLYDEWNEFVRGEGTPEDRSPAGALYQEMFLDELPPVVHFEQALEFHGYRRPGPQEYRATITCDADPCTYCRLESGPRRDEVIDKSGGHVYEDPIKALEYGHGMNANVFGASNHTVGLQRRSASRWEGVVTNEWEAERLRRSAEKYRDANPAVASAMERRAFNLENAAVATQVMRDDRGTMTAEQFAESARIEREADQGFGPVLCRNEEPLTAGDASSNTCIKPIGHEGEHLADGGARWINEDDDDDEG